MLIYRVANEDGPAMKLMSGLQLLVTLARGLQLPLSAHPPATILRVDLYAGPDRMPRTSRPLHWIEIAQI